MPTNLWPDFDTVQGARSPKAVIEEAGEGLATKTDGVVRFYRFAALIEAGRVQLQFSLYAKALSYHFPFLKARFAISPQYPVTLTADKLPDAVVKDESELIEALGRIFRAPSTVETIQRLISLAKE